MDDKYALTLCAGAATAALILGAAIGQSVATPVAETHVVKLPPKVITKKEYNVTEVIKYQPLPKSCLQMIESTAESLDANLEAGRSAGKIVDRLNNVNRDSLSNPQSVVKDIEVISPEQKRLMHIARYQLQVSQDAKFLREKCDEDMAEWPK